MSTPSRWASSPARPAGRTLKPMITASDAMARLTSSCVIAPTPRPITRRLTSSPTSSLSELSDPLAGLPALGDLPGHPVVGDDEEVVARAGHGGQAEHLHRPGRRC